MKIGKYKMQIKWGKLIFEVIKALIIWGILQQIIPNFDTFASFLVVFVVMVISRAEIEFE